MDQRARRASYVQRYRERDPFSVQVRTLAGQLPTDVLNVIESFVRQPQSLWQQLQTVTYWGPDRFVIEPAMIAERERERARKRRMQEISYSQNKRPFFRMR